MSVRHRGWLLGLCLGLLAPTGAEAQLLGTLSTPITVATIGRTNAATEGIVPEQGSGVKIRLLGFFLTSKYMVQVQFQDRAGTACTGTMTIASGGSVNVPVSPPGWVCETAANQALDLRVTKTGLTNSDIVVGGALMWQPSR